MDKIVGYSFEAMAMCPDCTMYEVCARYGVWNPDKQPVEQFLDTIADTLGIDRGDENSYDSGYFPKVIFDGHADRLERCSHCSEFLNDLGAIVQLNADSTSPETPFGSILYQLNQLGNLSIPALVAEEICLESELKDIDATLTNILMTLEDQGL